MSTNLMLRISGILALCTAAYHGLEGERILQTVQISPAEQIDFVRATYHIGTMGWTAGGVLLIAAASMASQHARNWIVGVLGVLYGIPALGTFALNNGRPSIGGIALAGVIIFAVLGRPIQNKAILMERS